MKVNLPTDGCKNFGPILESFPIASESSETLAPVASQIADIAFILDILCARKAFEA